MLATDMNRTTAYEVLGVSASNTLKEIRSAYRAMAKTLHPDSTDTDAEMQADFARIALAYEVLIKTHVEPQGPSVSFEESASTAEFEVKIGSFYCKLIVGTTNISDWYQRKSARLIIPLEYFEAGGNQSDFSMSHLNLDFGFELKIDVIDASHRVLFTSTGWTWESDYRRYKRTLKVQDLNSRIAGIKRRLESIPESRSVAVTTWKKVRKAERDLERYLWGWSSADLITNALNLIISIERECTKLESAEQPELIVTAMMAGRLRSTSYDHNLRVVREINSAAVRTGGFVDVYREEDLTEFYLEKIRSLGSSRAALEDPVLRLNLEDFIPEGLLDEPDLETAPEEVYFSSNKGQCSYRVDYRYEGELPVATVRLPLKVYDRHAPEHGRAHSFPALPHGIFWACEVVFDGKLIASGLVGEELNAAITKWKKGHRRSKHAEDHSTVGDLMFGAERSEVPPWYVGKSRPGRRK